MTTLTSRLSRFGWLIVAILASLLIFPDYSDARPGGGRSFGSRGSKTFQAPPTTNTAPKTAAPIDKSMTQPGMAGTQAAQSGAQAAGQAATQASRFGGMRSLLMGGLIGAGLASLFGMGAMANVLGFLLQAALIGGIIWLIFAFFRSRRTQPAAAGAGASPSVLERAQNANYRAGSGLGGAGGGPSSEVQIKPEDYNAFERLLGEIQEAYGRDDFAALETRLTPEMLSYFAEELDANKRRGVRNEVSNPKLLQGDLAEAWREGSFEYATVAMRYSIIDATIDTRTGRVVAGDKQRPQEVTEVWSFTRPSGADASRWELSAIQQA